jgi:hypothetical protein
LQKYKIVSNFSILEPIFKKSKTQKLRPKGAKAIVAGGS